MEPSVPVCKVEVQITNRLGLHARPAMTFVELANRFESTVTVRKADQVVDGKSIMQMMMLAATEGTSLQLEANGADAEDAIGQLQGLVERKFDEEE